MAMPVIVTVMVMPKRHHSHQVNYQSEGADHEQLPKSLGLPPLDNPLECFKHDLHADQYQEHAIGEPAQGLDLSKPIREFLVWRPLAGHRSEEADGQGHTVEKHVNAVAEKAERVRHIAIEGLNRHE